MEEIWSLDEESLESLKPCQGLIFLFKYRPGEEPAGSIVQDNRLDQIFFAKQVIRNACATQAILSVLLNTQHQDVSLGKVLSDFKTFTTGFDPADKGLAITNADDIRKVHNSFARPQMFDFDDSLASKDAYHFVGYVPFDGRLYELDGLREGPIDLGKCDSQNWLKSVHPVLDRRMQSFESDEVGFNLLAIVTDRKLVYHKKIDELRDRVERAATKMELVISGEAMEDSGDLPSDPEVLQAVIDSADEEIRDLEAQIAREEDKHQKYKLENIRRRHYYLPLVMEVLKLLAKRGQLVDLVENAQKKSQERKSGKEKAKP